MKKRIIAIACTLLLIGGGLICWHLVAQRFEPPHWGALIFDDIDTSKMESVSLLDRKLDECSERELLEMKVASCRSIAQAVAVHGQMGNRAGSAHRLAESHANLAAAMIELYRHTGEQEKLRVVLQARVEALTEKLRAVSNAYDADRVTLDTLHEAEIQLLDAVLEQKRTLASLDEE